MDDTRSEVAQLRRLLDEACSIAKTKYMSGELYKWWTERCEQLEEEREERKRRWGALREQAFQKLTAEEIEALRELG